MRFGARGGADRTDVRRRSSSTILTALLPAGDKKVTKRIEKAIDRLEQALDSDNWVNGFSLDEKDGKKFFDRARQAVKELAKIVEDGEPEAADAQAAIDDIVAVSSTLASNAITIAERNGARAAQDRQGPERDGQGRRRPR